MELLLLFGLLLLFLWFKWVMYIAARQSLFSVSLLLQVDQDSIQLDPLLHLICRCFTDPGNIALTEVWVIASGKQAEALSGGATTAADEHVRILQILSERYPALKLQLLQGDGSLAWRNARGQVLLCLDLVKGLTPLAALKAVREICAAGPIPPETMVLPI